ncbi:MAG: ABC transporter permease [Armatimonadota bacterium]|nr:ABC transporter permease [Armatimonadota bacterium]MDR5703149.1 ABC transporter permease [Armatimonadota bacterium]MDR7433981.1 ABC transporter permease [Armatimonadota bacterium]
MTRRLAAIVLKEFIQLVRDRRTLAMAILMPVIQLFLFGYAITTDVKHLPTAVLDLSKSPESRRLLEAFTNTQYYDVRFFVRDIGEIERLINSGRARVGIVIPPDYARRISKGDQVTVQVIVDASDPMVARSAITTARTLGQLRSFEAIIAQIPQLGSSGEELPFDVRVRAWYNPDLRSVNFMVPGLLAVVLQLLTMLLTAMAIVRERELGTLEQLVVTPITKTELMLGKILPYVALGYVDITLALLVSSFWFRVPVRGSVLLLYVVTLSFYLSTLGMGILISTLSRNQRQAMQGAFFIVFPSFLISGFLFPREGMPLLLQWLSYLLPLTYFLIIVRGIILKGIGLSYLWPQVLPMTILGLLFFVASVIRFQKRLE